MNEQPYVVPESKWPMAVTVAIAAALAFSKPDWLAYIPQWMLPGMWLALLVVLMFTSAHRATPAPHLRLVSVGLALLVTASALESAVALTLDIVYSNGHTANAASLLIASGIVWGLNIIGFSLLYWEFDGGGPWARAHNPRPFPDLAFPQTTSPRLAPPTWRPRFLDYLYLGFTNMTAFSPTDVMPMAVWAKALMAIQALVSVVILMLVVSRAINILN